MLKTKFGGNKIMGFKFQIEKFIIKHEKINYFQTILRKSCRKSFRNQVLEMNQEKNDCFHIRSFGNLNKGKIIYLYDVNDSVGMGFFAVYRNMIEACFFAELYGFIPVFHWGKDFPYSESHVTINGETDSYQQFFKQPSNLNYAEARQSFAVMISSGNKRSLSRKLLFGKPDIESIEYSMDQEYFKKMSEYSKKYIHMNDMISESISSDIHKLLGSKKTLAVHVRIKVFQHGIDRHPVAASLEKYIEMTKKALKQNNFEQIFLATEESETVDIFSRTFGDQVVFYDDVLRMSDGNVTYVEGKRENHKYRLGYEVLRDMHTMAKCSGLIGGLSQVAFCTQITKYESGQDFEFKQIFDLGVHHNNYTPKDDYKKLKKRERKK